MPDSVVKPDQTLYGFAVQQMRQGVASDVIEKSLIKQGLEAQKAATIVSNLKQAKAKGLKDAGRKNMLYGVMWCLGGIVVTALSYQAAANSGGGRYVLAWGAILFGGIQFVRGMIQSSGR
jgi:predicted ABC-type sugar transport system permease subunit